MLNARTTRLNERCLFRHQRGASSMLMVAGIVALVMFLSVSDTGVLSLKKESVKNAWDVSKAQLNATEGLNQLQAFFNSLDHNLLSTVQAQFENPVASVCNDPKKGPVGTALPKVFKPILSAERIASGDKIEIYTTVSHREDYCQNPAPSAWKLNYRIVGSYQCDMQGAGACAMHELHGSIIPSETAATVTCTPEKDVCKQVEFLKTTDATEVTCKTCGQNDSYEFKPLNLGEVGGFNMGEVYSGAVAANPNRITNMQKLWKAPITVTGDIINGSMTSQMLAEGLETNLAVSFAENALFFGAHNMPPLPYYKPVEIGGQVIARNAVPSPSYGTGSTTGIGLKVLGATPMGSKGELGSSSAGPVRVDYSYLKHPANTGGDLSPDLLSPPLLQQTANFSSSLSGSSVYTNAEHLKNLRGKPDDVLKHFLGLNRSDLENVSKKGTGFKLDSMLPIEVAQKSAQGLFTGSKATDDEKDWRKVGVVYYYVDVRGKPTTTLQYQKAGANVSKSPVYSSGQGGKVSEFKAQPAYQFCEDNPQKVPNGDNGSLVDFEVLVKQHNIANDNRNLAISGSAKRDPQLGCEVVLEKQDPVLWQQIKNNYSTLISSRTTADSTRERDVQAAKQNYQPAIDFKNQELINLEKAKNDALKVGDQAEADRIQLKIDSVTLERNRLQSELSQAITQADTTKSMSYQAAQASWESALNLSQARAVYQSALGSESHKKIKTTRNLIENRRWDSYAAYTSGSTPRWIRDHWNNPHNPDGGCLSWDTTVNKVPCNPPFSGAQSMQDNAVVVVDARGTDGVYWRHLDYPAAQLIIVLGNLYVEDVILNANIVVDGDLVLLNRGFAVAPRRWWGIPRYKKCTSTLNMSAPITQDPDRLPTSQRMGGLFYFFTDRTDQVRNCIVARNQTSSTEYKVETVCEMGTVFCQADSKTSISRLEPSIRFFER